jgi:hypothetical protein
MNIIKNIKNIKTIRNCSTKEKSCCKNMDNYIMLVGGCTVVGTVYGFYNGIMTSNKADSLDIQLFDVVGSTLCGTMGGLMFGVVSPIVLPIAIPAYVCLKVKESME